MKVLIAGKGFIGSRLGEKLESQGHDVDYLDRSDADYEEDITRDFNVEGYFDVLIHTIGLSPGFHGEEEYWKVHVEGTKNLLDAVDCGKVIYLSALGAGEIDHSFLRTKKAAEELVENSGNDYTIIRPSTVYGEENKLLELMGKFAFTRLFPDIKTEMQPIHGDDFTDLIVETLEDYNNETLNAAGKERIKMGEMARHLYREKGCRCFLVPHTQPLIEAQFRYLGFFSPPFHRENLELLRNDNTTDENDAEEILELREIFSRG